MTEQGIEGEKKESAPYNTIAIHHPLFWAQWWEKGA